MISYCTTCKGRLHHLRETLPKNLEAEKDNPDIEFVILDYTSEDGLGDWIKQNYSKEIASGRIRYARYDDGVHFKMAHAKNMAHRLATGDVLCNLDADNIISKDFSKYLNKLFQDNPHTILTRIRLSLGDYCKTAFIKRKGVLGLGGRIAVSRDDFIELGGYDESISGWGPDDFNFGKRAVAVGLKEVLLSDEFAGSVLSHSHEERISNLDPNDAVKSRDLMRRTKLQIIIGDFTKLIRHPPSQANLTGQVGCGNVRINFSDEVTTIPPIDMSHQHARGRNGNARG